MKKIIIASVSKNGIIGRKGRIPWDLKSDMIHFRETTLDFPVIMGRLTFESIGRPLERRTNIILSRKGSLIIKEISGIVHCTSIENAYDYCSENNFNKIFIIGGAQIFNQTINEVDEMILSRINFSADGDAEFPEINPKIWILEDSKKYDEFELQKYVKTH